MAQSFLNNDKLQMRYITKHKEFILILHKVLRYQALNLTNSIYKIEFKVINKHNHNIFFCVNSTEWSSDAQKAYYKAIEGVSMVFQTRYKEKVNYSIILNSLATYYIKLVGI